MSKSESIRLKPTTFLDLMSKKKVKTIVLKIKYDNYFFLYLEINTNLFAEWNVGQVSLKRSWWNLLSHSLDIYSHGYVGLLRTLRKTVTLNNLKQLDISFECRYFNCPTTYSLQRISWVIVTVAISSVDMRLSWGVSQRLENNILPCFQFETLH